MLTLLTFILPPDEGEKIGLGTDYSHVGLRIRPSCYIVLSLKVSVLGRVSMCECDNDIYVVCYIYTSDCPIVGVLFCFRPTVGGVARSTFS